ncbi:MAG: hypothetical protein AAF620_11300 [Bacteroidota bacterium]
MEVILTNLDGTLAQNPLQPDTQYRLYFRATGNACFTAGYGCDTEAAPTSFRITQFTFGCTIDGFSIPPTTNVGRDVGPGNNYTTSFMTLRTLPDGQFFGQVFFAIEATGTVAGVCVTNVSGVKYTFDSSTDLPTPPL